MLKIIADTHTHTIACDHAYSTLAENAAAAKAKGLAALAMTEHAPSMPGGPSWLHFSNLGMVPREIGGVRIIKGAEVNIIDYNGMLDLKDGLLCSLEWVIASMHTPCLTPSGSPDDCTRAWLAVAKNPLIDVIGHSGDSRYPFDYETALRAFKEYGKIVEINSHSFAARPGSRDNCAKIARICAEMEIHVVVSSDAHHASRVGEFGEAVNMLGEIGFPERLILNADENRFFTALEARKAYRLRS